MNGILNVYKEAGYTSFDVVAKLRGILQTKKIGHGGTLDPQVTGVLPIAVGNATRLLEYMEGAGKVYEGQITIGFSTETEDAYGQTIAITPVKSAINEREIDESIKSFIGKIEQTPPMYSAVKVNGKRLYEYARKGERVERPSRQVDIKEFVRTSDVVFDSKKNIIIFDFKVSCSKGTYIRTLAVDLAKQLGYAGYMSALKRTASNGLNIEDAVTLQQLEKAKKEDKIAQFFYPLEYAVSDMIRLDIDKEQYTRVQVGKFFEENEFSKEKIDSAEDFAIFYENHLVAIYKKHPQKKGMLKPQKVLAIDKESK
ncbi:MAG: tRNA pseudouridine(55) synthase TruB [Streptococcaceae bacterium]|nr:tRNA pseudouridine(55) synthase TruB [Streptococcaceae bacterium]